MSTTGSPVIEFRLHDGCKISYDPRDDELILPQNRAKLERLILDVMKEIHALKQENALLQNRKRDLFAAHALHGLCCDRDEAGLLISKGSDWIASQAYQIADAMLRARGE